MASVMLPAVLPDHDALPPSSTPAHTRKHSRNPSRAPLPSFSFNPGAVDQAASQDVENRPPEEDGNTNKGHMRRSSKPPPLPDFKFNPGANIPTNLTPSPTHPVLEEMALNQQRVSRSARPAPLPMFTFNPSAVVTPPIPSPTRSDTSESENQKTAGGHRRGGSEFVGGGLGGAQMVSTSPSKHDHRPSGPPVTSTNMRGHAHRRSQAVSVSDIDTSELIKAHALAKHRAGSGPSTPNDPVSGFSFSRESPQTRHSVSYTARSPPSSPRRRGSASGVRPRVVDFSDKVDVIPRPLSIISSETETSTSTVRGHSLSNSINSLASQSRMVTPQIAVSLSPALLEEEPQPRPNTADPISTHSLASSSRSHLVTEINLPQRPVSASGSPSPSTASGKRKHFWFSSSNNSSPSSTPNLEKQDPMEILPAFTPSAHTEKNRPRTSPERSTSMRRRKHHPWTVSFLPRKVKHRSVKSKDKRQVVAPLKRQNSDRINRIFDADHTVVLQKASSAVDSNPSLASHSLNIPPPSRPVEPSVASPMIDLDAALGPFGSEERFGGDGQKKATSRIAKLHSSERRGLVDAFGAVHRRTESAPSMPAVNRTLFGLNRQGSNGSLAEEVFDEEEEDNFLADQRKVKSKGIELGQHRSESMPCRSSASGLGLSNVSNPSDDVVIVDYDTEAIDDDSRSSKSTLEPPMLAREDLPKRPATSPVAFAYPTTQMHYASSTEGRTTSASLISSPDLEHSQADTHVRLNRLGEMSPEFLLRPSNDDLPSLSDSISSGALPRISSSANTRSSTEQRSQSMFVPSTSKAANSWKRSSLASLNRLIPGSSNGSKLKFETVPEVPVEEKTKKKTNRISKLMHFWRSKDNSKA